MKTNEPKILVFDIETSYLEGIMWDIWEVNIPFNNLKEKEWSIIAFSAKWLGDKKTIYHDNRKKRNKRDDKEIVKKLRDLLDEADVIVTKNGKRFDEKMFNARCAKHEIQPPSPYEHHDVERGVRRRFKLVSFSLEYLCYFFKTKYRKLKHVNFPGMSLWLECMAGNMKAWKEMEQYNIYDVLSSEELYVKLRPWFKEFNTMHFHDKVVCDCGSTKIQKRGTMTTKAGVFTRYACQNCGTWFKGKENLKGRGSNKYLLAKQ